MAIPQRVSFDLAVQGRQWHAFGVRRTIALVRQSQRVLPHNLGKLRRLGQGVDQAPILGFLAAHALAGGGKNIRQIVSHVAFVGDPRQSAGAGQHAQKRHLRQADGAGAVVDQDDFVAGQRQLVAAAGAGTVHRREEFQAAILGRILQPVAGFVGEFAEIDLPRMAGQAEHVNVGTGAEDALFAAGQHDGADLRVFEADPVHGVVQLDIDPEVVAVQLELVAGAQAGIFVEIRDQRRHRSVEGEFPVPVAGGVGLVIDGEIGGHGGLPFKAGLRPP